jgi:hypothetical protein
MKKLPMLVLVFSLAFIVFLIVPPLLGFPFGPFPLMSSGDAFDILTPLVLLPLYWALFVACCPDAARNTRAVAVFMALAGLWAMGQGMHLAANSIGHYLSDMNGGDIFRLSHFYDEVLSHYLWHLGIIGLSIFLIFHEWRGCVTGSGRSWPVLIAGLIYGFSYFLIVIEAGTAPVGITFAVFIVLFGIFRGRHYCNQKTLLAFFSTAYALAVLLFIIWAIMWGGLPQFSEVGWL